MAGFQTGSAELIQAARQMEDTNQQLMSSLSQLATEVEGVASNWVGTAHTAFQNLMERFQTDAKNLNDDLRQISDAVGLNAKEYQRQEDESEQSISAITSALG